MRVSHRCPRIHLVALSVLLEVFFFASSCKERIVISDLSSRLQLFEMIGYDQRFEGRLYGAPFGVYKATSSHQKIPVSLLRKALKFVAESHGDKAVKLSNMAVVYALGGDTNRAISTELDAIKSEGVRPWMLSDLAVLYLERFRVTHDALDLLKSLDASAQAKNSPVSSPESQFNSALLLEKLSLYSLAQDAWEAYENLDRASPWSAEAKVRRHSLKIAEAGERWKRLQDLIENSSAEHVSGLDPRDIWLYSNKLLEHAETLIGQWGESWRQGRPQDADRALLLARRIGRQLSLVVGEHMISDTVAVIDRYLEKDSIKLTSLARSQAVLQKAIDQDLKEGCSKASILFRSSWDELETLGSPFYRLAWFRLTLCDYRNSNYTAARKGLNALKSLPYAGRYALLRGSLEATLGLISGIEGDPAASWLGYEQALEAFGLANKDENSAHIESLQAECLRSMGNLRRAWEFSWKSLQAASGLLSKRKKYSVFSEAANIAEDLSLPWAAIMLMDEALRSADGSSLMESLVALRWRAVLLTRLGQYQEARDSVMLAQKMLSGLGDPDAKAVLSGDLLAIRGEILARTDPYGAVLELSRAVEMYQRMELTQQLEELLLQRGKVQASLLQQKLAEADFSQAIDLLESTRRRTPINEREAFLDNNRDVYDRMAEVQLAMGRKLEALRYVDESRSRVLLDRLMQADGSIKLAGGPGVLQGQIAKNSTLIAYSFLGTTCHAWVLRKDGLEVVRLGADSGSIKQTVELLRNLAETNGTAEDFRRASSHLFDLIVRPVLPYVGAASHLVFIPDECLFKVPFPALLDKSSGRFLVEDFIIEIEPSISIYSLLIGRSAVIKRLPASPVLVVGGALMERHSWASLSNLGASEGEATRVSGLYPKALTLVGKSATPERFLGEAPRYHSIHISAHAMHGLGDSGLSLLVLSPIRPGESGALYPAQISKLQLSVTRVVFLNSCASLGLRTGKTEGLSNLAGAFLGAGVPTVIASIWNIDDERSRNFAVSFHELVSSGVEPSSALRFVQLEYIHGRSEGGGWPSWASYEAFGI